MTKQQIEDAFKDCESLKGKELRGECFIDFAAVWWGEQNGNRPSGLVVWIVGAALIALTIITSVIILI